MKIIAIAVFIFNSFISISYADSTPSQCEIALGGVSLHPTAFDLLKEAKDQNPRGVHLFAGRIGGANRLVVFLDSSQIPDSWERRKNQALIAAFAELGDLRLHLPEENAIASQVNVPFLLEPIVSDSDDTEELEEDEFEYEDKSEVELAQRVFNEKIMQMARQGELERVLSLKEKERDSYQLDLWSEAQNHPDFQEEDEFGELVEREQSDFIFNWDAVRSAFEQLESDRKLEGIQFSFELAKPIEAQSNVSIASELDSQHPHLVKWLKTRTILGSFIAGFYLFGGYLPIDLNSIPHSAELMEIGKWTSYVVGGLIAADYLAGKVGHRVHIKLSPFFPKSFLKQKRAQTEFDRFESALSTHPQAQLVIVSGSRKEFKVLQSKLREQSLKPVALPK